ncbi:hypothetical protein D9756_002023 [Leucocoprinus leucothites]|uniref:Uncharacterized protein n=1 Tax=Leucocoprinus leucothites TaxID=201217 RepID=A0A8H5GCD0_9AGAR|nr:hypothetical protein D9756_002023 [Leucoagaricus leucothites]
MPTRLSVRLLVLISIFFPSLVSAGGSNGLGGDGLELSHIPGAGDSSFHLERIDAAHFAFCVIFAVVTAFQVLHALWNIRRRAIKLPPSISTPEFSTGWAFPIFLLISTVLLIISYVLHAVYWGIETNLHNRHPPSFTPSFIGAWNTMRLLADILLLSSMLALLTHRGKALLNTSRHTRNVKRAADVILVVILFGLSMGNVGLRVAGVAKGVRHNLYLAYLSLFLLGVLDVAIHSTILYAQSRESTVNDHSITLCTAFIISPLFFVYAIFPILLEGLLKPDVDPSTERDRGQWALAGLIVGCITKVIIIQACLRFGMPPIPKDTARTYAPRPEKV